VQNSLGSSSGHGEGINGNNVLNSTGSSYSGDGIAGTSVQNCYGVAALTGTGIICPAGIVSGSYGNSVYGTGLTATIADFCRATGFSGSPSFNVTHSVNSY